LSKILHINASYKPAYVYGGPTISISTLCEKLKQAGETVEVFTTTANGKEDFHYSNGQIINVDGIDVHYFKRITKDHSHFSPALLIFLSKNLKHYSVVHIHAWWNLVSVGAAFIAWIKGKRIVFSPRGQLNEYSFITNSSAPKKLFHSLIGKRILKTAHFQVSSENEARDISALFSKPSIQIIPNFINLPTGNINPLKQVNQPLRLLFFSRIEQKKGLQFLLKSLKILSFPFTLDIYGTGEEAYINELKLLIEDTEKDKVFWREPVFGDEKFKIFAEHDLVILPSFAENFANVIVESLAVGTAVMVTKEVGLSHYVEKKNFGYICTQNPNEIASILNTIASSTDTLSRIREESPLTIMQDFGEQTLIKSYIEFYRKVDTVN
jgi:glycosyltransferase involved in cell wall biosynthesis